MWGLHVGWPLHTVLPFSSLREPQFYLAQPWAQLETPEVGTGP